MALPVVRVLYEGIVEQLTSGPGAVRETEESALVAEEFSAENGTFTASMKLRRRVVEERGTNGD